MRHGVPLPTRMIAELLGAPPDDWERFRRWSDACTGNADPEIEMDALVAVGELFGYFQEHIAGRSFEETRHALRSHLRTVRKRVLDDENAFTVVAAPPGAPSRGTTCCRC